MVEEITKSRLGRGLAALIGDVGEEFESGSTKPKEQRRVAIEFLRRNPRNPRAQFPEEALDELAASIRERGVIQPIVVRPIRDLPDAFEIIAGERRWRAAQRAGLHEVPIVVVEADDRTALELAIIENVQRSDLAPLDEAAGYEALIAGHGYSQTDLATVLGKSRSHVTNTIRLLKLPPAVRDMVGRGELSAGHARALLAVADPESVARRAVEQGLTVRDLERIGQGGHEGESPRLRRPRREPDADTRAVQDALEQVLGLVVRVDHRGGAGELRIRYGSLDQLDALCRRLRAAG